MILVGTAGHIDHGKSALVEALTGVNPMRLPEEKAREMTIDLGFAHLTHPDGYVLGIVDVPGHEKLVRTMVAGATGFQLALWVIDAREGLMPQSLEHLQILDLLGVPRIIPVITKAGLASASSRASGNTVAVCGGAPRSGRGSKNKAATSTTNPTTRTRSIPASTARLSHTRAGMPEVEQCRSYCRRGQGCPR
jgi:small GTP-binding protein